MRTQVQRQRGEIRQLQRAGIAKCRTRHCLPCRISNVGKRRETAVPDFQFDDDMPLRSGVR
jgi:hypothetical protein